MWIQRVKMASLLHVEITQLTGSDASPEHIRRAVSRMIDKSNCLGAMTIRRFDDPFLTQHVESIQICETSEMFPLESRPNIQIIYHVYRLRGNRRCDLAFEEDEDGEKITCASQYLLPNAEFQGLWESLIYEHKLKDNLLSFVESVMLFSDQGVDTNFVSCNRVVLLHGPPGTGKTSLCKALAQKLSIRLSNRYDRFELLEVNTHSLFSKWFSESSKLVLKMFSNIRDVVADGKSMVCVLIDEVETLTHARQSAMRAAEPSDAIRVVNAVITQLDTLKVYSNVLILATSNISTGIDLAFVDRADIKQFIGFPPAPAIYDILKSCIKELQKSEIIVSKESIMNLKLLELTSFQNRESTSISLKLLDIARMCEGIGGRTLRKLPLLAHAYFLQKKTVSLNEFLDGLEKALLKYRNDCVHFKSYE